MMMYLIVAYDVVDNNRRRKLAKLTRNFGARVQKSVFEMDIDNQNYF